MQNAEFQRGATTENGNQKQCFLTANLRFNLRQRDTEKPTILYCVLRLHGQKFTMNSGVKIYPNQWNKRKQLAVISNELSPLDNRNNTIVNDRITNIRQAYNTTISKLKDNPDEVSKLIYIFAEHLNIKAMTRTKKQTPFTDELATLNNKDNFVSEGRKEGRKASIKHLTDYFKAYKLENAPTSINLKNWEGFKSYMLEAEKGNGEHYSQGAIQETLNGVKRLFSIYNEAHGSIIISTEGLKPLKLKKKLNTGQKQSKHIEITETDIERLYSIKLKSESQQRAKDLFLFQCCIGCRVSDLKKIIESDVTPIAINGVSFINYHSKKTNTEANTPLYTKTAKDLFNWVRTLKEFPFNDNAHYNKQLQQAFKNIGGEYDNIVTVTEQRGGKIQTKEKPMWAMFHNHEARHIFVTNMYYRGIPRERVILMTGHASTNIIDEVYMKHNTDKDLLLLASDLQATPQTNEFDSLIREIKMYKAGFYAKVSNAVKTMIKETAIFNNCGFDRACDIMLENLK